ncbi:hypothetical protein NC652_039486 [Populus alba x Populus x berolinensis]|nr:hypothetical protein NC652_039486 [Populus alba x Populus x berolinensis]
MLLKRSLVHSYHLSCFCPQKCFWHSGTISSKLKELKEVVIITAVEIFAESPFLTPSIFDSIQGRHGILSCNFAIRVYDL